MSDYARIIASAEAAENGARGAVTPEAQRILSAVEAAQFRLDLQADGPALPDTRAEQDARGEAAFPDLSERSTGGASYINPAGWSDPDRSVERQQRN